MTAKAKILVIHGGGAGSYNYDAPLANFVCGLVDDPARVAYPKLDNLERIVQFDWRITRRELVAALANLADDGQVIGHSLGGAAILKLLSEDGVVHRIKGLFLVAAPYICKDGAWSSEDFALENDFAVRLPACGDIYLYHSRDDEIVPLDHVHLYAEKLMQASVRVVDGYGHQFASKPFVELGADVMRQLAR